MKLPEDLRTAAAGLAAAGSVGLLVAAFGFQHLVGLVPCELCIWQRWPHVVAGLAGLALLAPALRFARGLRVLGALSMAAAAGLGLYHTGVERRWWEGPSECSGALSGDLSTDELMAAILEAPMVRCTEVTWELFGLSMSSWQGISALGLGAFWIASLVWPQGSSSASQ